MGKAAAKRNVSTTIVQDEIERNLAQVNASSMFLGATLNMGWRLAVTVVIPIVGGVKLDQHYDTSPTYTLIGMLLAAVAGSTAVWATVRDVNTQVADQASPRRSKKPKEKN